MAELVQRRASRKMKEISQGGRRGGVEKEGQEGEQQILRRWATCLQRFLKPLLSLHLDILWWMIT